MNFFFLYRNLINASALLHRDYKSRKKSLIVITAERSDNELMLNKLFGLAWKFGVLDFNVLLPQRTELQWTLVTYLPFQQNCIGLDLHFLSTFYYSNYTNDMNITLDELYPSKNRNFNKCPITIATYNVPPYVMIKNKTINGQNISIYDGIEVTVIKNIAKAINLTLRFENIGRKGDVYENGTVTYSVKEVIRSTTNSFTPEKVCVVSIFFIVLNLGG